MKKRISAAVFGILFLLLSVCLVLVDGLPRSEDGLITEKFGEGALLLWIAVEPFYVYHRK